jgi:hypothetical protein
VPDCHVGERHEQHAGRRGITPSSWSRPWHGGSARRSGRRVTSGGSWDSSDAVDIDTGRGASSSEGVSFFPFLCQHRGETASRERQRFFFSIHYYGILPCNFSVDSGPLAALRFCCVAIGGGLAWSSSYCCLFFSSIFAALCCFLSFILSY